MGLGRVELPTSRLSGPCQETRSTYNRVQIHGVPSARHVPDVCAKPGISSTARTQNVPGKANVRIGVRSNGIGGTQRQ